MEDIDAGLAATGGSNPVTGTFRSIAPPSLGSGLGGLDWSEVRPHIESGAA